MDERSKRIRVAVLSVAAVSLLAAGLVLTRRSGGSGGGAEVTAPQPVKPVAVEAPIPVAAPLVARPASAPAAAPVVAAQKATGVRIRPDQVLLLVNQVPVKGGDLGSFGGQVEQVLNPEMYRSLLDRAVRRELVVQEARKRGIALGASEQQEVANLRAAMEKQYGPEVILPAAMDPARVAFEVRDSEGLLLEAALYKHEGVPSSQVTPEDVTKYYREHQSEFELLPEAGAARELAWRQIENRIRTDLAQMARARYEEGSRQVMSRLRAAAQIGPPVDGRP